MDNRGIGTPWRRSGARHDTASVVPREPRRSLCVRDRAVHKRDRARGRDVYIRHVHSRQVRVGRL